jgi:aminomethyltransferase
MPDSPLRRTPLYDRHLAAGGKIVPFAGWEMPVQYRGVIDEHRAVRTAAGLFDVSHMGEIRIAGAGALDFVQRLTPNDVARLEPGRIHYNAFLTPEGTFIDDLLVYRMAADEILIVVNAANAAGDFAWVASHPHPGLAVEDVSERWALIALQGPKAVAILQPLTPVALDAIKYYRFAHGTVAGTKAILSRTGYTGEDGFELFVDPGAAPAVWDRLLEAGAPHGLTPAGLGARDTLRLEAGMSLYGHEIDRTTTPWEAGLDWIVQLGKGDFVGRDALVAARERGPARRIVGFEVEGRGIARDGFAVAVGGEVVGKVTSGTFSPTLERALGMALVATPHAAPGTAVEIDVRGRPVAARLRPIPFYKRATEAGRARERGGRRTGFEPRGETRCIRARTATRAITSGCGSRTTSASSASPTSPRRSWARWSTSSCPRSGTCSTPTTRSAPSSRSRRWPRSTPRSPARSSRSTGR